MHLKSILFAAITGLSLLGFTDTASAHHLRHRHHHHRWVHHGYYYHHHHYRHRHHPLITQLPLQQSPAALQPTV